MLSQKWNPTISIPTTQQNLRKYKSKFRILSKPSTRKPIKAPVPSLDLKFVRPVTPNLLIKLSTLAQEAPDISIRTETPEVVLSIIPMKSQKSLRPSLIRSASCTRRRSRISKDIVKREHLQKDNLSENSRELKYSNFKDYHLSSFRTINKKARAKCLKDFHKSQKKIERIKGIVEKDIKAKTPDGNHAHQIDRGCIYPRPAVSFGEKMFRLKQISIFDT